MADINLKKLSRAELLEMMISFSEEAEAARQHEKELKEELEKDGPSVIISRRPCALLKYVKHNAPLKCDKDKCVGCKQCLKIGCPAISIHNGKMEIDHTLCVGCGICKEMCKLGAIGE